MNITTPLIAAVLALSSAQVRAADQAETTPPKQLDLRPPNIAELYTFQQLQRLIAKMEADNIEEIEVEGARMPAPTFNTPQVWPAIAAPFWAMLHPTQAWRIFAPIPPDQALTIGNQRADTEGFLEPIGVPPGDPFKQ